MIYKFSMEVPEKLSFNKVYTLSWYKRKAEADLYHEYIATYANKLKIVSTMKFPLILEFNYYWTGRSLDVSNCCYMNKLIEDGFTLSGIIPDDRNKYIKQINTTSQKQHDKSIKVDMVVIRFIDSIQDH